MNHKNKSSRNQTYHCFEINEENIILKKKKQKLLLP